MSYTEHLVRQLNFLKRSCDSYDDGFRDEAIRIAVSIRVLMHDTNRSTSLLKHLDSKSIRLLSSASSATEKAIVYFGLGIHCASVDSARYIPMLGKGPPVYGFVTLGEWWEQIVYIKNGHRISRKMIVLSASNKDGGAHVDRRLDPAYESLMAEGFVGSLVCTVDDREFEMHFDDAHYVALRQMGFELLNSPELTDLMVGI